MEVCRSMPRIDFSRTVYVHLEPSLTLITHSRGDGRTLRTKVRRNLPSGLDPYIWAAGSNPLCVFKMLLSVLVCVCACVFGLLFATYEKYSRGRDNAPTAGEDEIICKWLVKAHRSFS